MQGNPGEGDYPRAQCVESPPHPDPLPASGAREKRGRSHVTLCDCCGCGRADLPQAGIKGNSHMIMMDKNNAEVAGLIQKWLEGKGLTK